MFMKAVVTRIELVVVNVAGGDSSASFFEVPFDSGLVNASCNVPCHKDKPFSRAEVGEAAGGIDEHLE